MAFTQRPGPQRQAGFGLLEAIVATVILGSSGLALFAWISQSLDGIARVRQAEVRAGLQLEAQNWLQQLNPAQRPDGQERTGSIAIAWQSELVEPMLDESDYRGNLVPRWRIGLFRVTATASRGDIQVQWRQLVAGWRLRDTGPVPSLARSAAGSG